MPEFVTELIKTDVTALKVHQNLLYAGVGSEVQIYDLNAKKLLTKHTVFNGLRIHGIQINQSGSHLLLNAENEVLIIRIQPTFDLLRRIECNDWILATRWLYYNNFAFVTMHNEIEFHADDFLTLDRKKCATNCILYCAEICNDTLPDCVVLSGTVFSEILIWRPHRSCEVYHRLKGHAGVLFSIHRLENYILSTSDDRSVILWKVQEGDLRLPDVKIALEHKMHGHTARVFRGMLLPDCILSAGEDARICVWSYKGVLLRSFSLHHGGCVWSLDQWRGCIVSGGSDASIVLSPLTSSDAGSPGSDYKLSLTPEGTPKKLALLRNGDVVIAMDDGSLLHHSRARKEMKTMGKFEAFQSYVLLTVSGCRQRFALAGIKGDIYVFLLSNDEIIEELRFYIPHRQRIYAIHSLTTKYLLTCESAGRLLLWKIHNKTLLLIGVYELPPSKERWSTAACRIHRFGFVVGDRKGHLHLYRTRHSHPVQTVKRAHSNLGVTNIYYNERTAMLTTFGRNATQHTFHFHDGVLVSVVVDMLPFAWLAMQLTPTTLLGFSGDEMIVWDHARRLQTFVRRCGGGHRSFDAYCDKFVYIKDKNVCVVSITQSLELTASVHATEINAITAIRFGSSPSILCISGGEDTTLRFSLINNHEMSNVSTIKSHLSSIRCLRLINDCELITAGGRGQLIYWRLQIQKNALDCKQLDAFYEPQDEEVRIMDLTHLQLKKLCYVFAGCSDGSVRIYLLESAKIVPFRTLLYKSSRCILKLAILRFDLMVTMATDGLLCFWRIDFEDSCEPFFSYQVHQSGINAFDYKFVENTNLLWFLTGGDDNQISLLLCRLKSDDAISILGHYKNCESHCAQITGAVLRDGYFLTASLDQKLLIFEYCFDDDQGTIVVNYRGVHSSCINDIKGMICLTSETDIELILYGFGVELLSLQL